MDCGRCFEPVPPRSAYCPHCGAHLAGAGPVVAPPESTDPTYMALARANLLRLRGSWDAAREQVATVIRLYPNSATAYSLMGDIHADQQMYTDAAQWYRMALDLDPKNQADSRKLAATEARLGESPVVLADEMAGPPSISGFRIAATAAGIFLVVFIALGFWMRGRNPVYTDPNAGLQESTYGKGYARRAPGRPPVVTPPATTRPQTPASNGAAAGTITPRPAPEKPAPEPVEPPAPTVTQQETTLLTALRTLDSDLAAVGLRLAGLQWDERTHEAAITLDGSGVNGARPDWMTTVQAAALKVAQRSMGDKGETASVTVRVVMPLAMPRGIVRDVAFVGEMKRARQADVTTVPEAFTSVWWHEGLTPPGDRASAVWWP